MTELRNLYKRGSISIRGTTHARVQAHCIAHGKTLTGFIEAVIAERLDTAGVPRVLLKPRSLLAPTPMPTVKPQSPIIEDGYVTPHLEF